MSESTNCVDTIAAFSLPIFPIFLALGIRQIPCISAWLDVRYLGILDMAVSGSSVRKVWLFFYEVRDKYEIWQMASQRFVDEVGYHEKH
jgi:hypothetical protein